MKKILLASAALLFVSAAAFSQTSIEFIPTAGYAFGSRTNFDNYYGKLSGGPMLGGSFQFNFNPHFGLAVEYARFDGTGKMYQYGTGPQNSDPVSSNHAGINYITLNPTARFGFVTSPVHFFIAPMIGAAIFTPGPNPTAEGYSSNARFAMGAQLGTDIYFTDRIGLRIAARFLSPMEGSNNGKYFGNFGNDNSGDYFNSNALSQFDFHAGLIIGIGPAFRTHARERRQYEHRDYQPRQQRRYYYY